MRKIKSFMLLAIVIMISMMSCNNEELFIEPNVEVVEDDTTIEEEGEEEDTSTTVDTSLPCEFTLNNVESNSTIVINCTIDLEGATVNLPANITLVYEGGEIINGTINFSESSVIDGELLNSTFAIGGTYPQLKDPTFHFDVEKWEIVQGIVSDDVATVNMQTINKTINLTKELGAYTFSLDNIDAYFNVSRSGFRHYTDATILIPSNFHFKMGDKCNLRVQPNGFQKSVLIYCRSTENVIISGGKLWGDRYSHDYTTISGTHDWGHIIMFRGVHDSFIDDVEIHEGGGDGIQIGGVEHRNDDGSIKPNGRESKNVTIKKCLINDNRRNNISVVDGTDIFIEYNKITNAGSGDDSSVVSSNGMSPRAGIDVEAFKNTIDGAYVYDWEKTEDIHIRNNTFEDNYAADVALYNGEKTYVYENTFRSERGVSSAYSYNNKIYNNSFEKPVGVMTGEDMLSNGQAINLSPRYWANGTHRITDFEVYNNTFTGYKFGVIVGGKGHKFYNNTFTDCQRAFTLITSENLVLDNNTISSSLYASAGYDTYAIEESIKNCLIKNGVTNVDGPSLNLKDKNNLEVGDITIDNMVFEGIIRLSSVQNVTIKNSTFEDITIVDCNPTLVNNN